MPPATWPCCRRAVAARPHPQHARIVAQRLYWHVARVGRCDRRSGPSLRAASARASMGVSGERGTRWASRLAGFAHRLVHSSERHSGRRWFIARPNVAASVRAAALGNALAQFFRGNCEGPQPSSVRDRRAPGAARAWSDIGRDDGLSHAPMSQPRGGQAGWAGFARRVAAAVKGVGRKLVVNPALRPRPEPPL